MRGNSFFALLAGAAIGVAAGILLAPDKGSETRKKLKEKFFNVPVSEVMTKSPVCVSPNMKINKITNLLGEKKIHAVMVVDENKHLLGIVDNFRCMI